LQLKQVISLEILLFNYTTKRYLYIFIVLSLVYINKKIRLNKHFSAKKIKCVLIEIEIYSSQLLVLNYFSKILFKKYFRGFEVKKNLKKKHEHLRLTFGRETTEE
jgi:hypothetical protein